VGVKPKPFMSLRAVMDTNVLYAGLRSRRGASAAVLEALWLGKWRLLLSNTVVAEYEEVLKREAATLNLDLAEIDRLLNALCTLAERHQLGADWTPVLTDPDDEAFVHLAAAAQADYLVSHNVRHLEPIHRWGVKLLEPKAFLAILPA